MKRDKEHNPDPNENAKRIVAESTSEASPPPRGLEEAWREWSKHIQNVDERGMELLQAAFEAGWEAGKPTSGAAALGRLGGLKGGKARAASLSREQRAEIAKKAAATRWKKKD